MEIFDALMAGFATAITPANLLWALVGCALGTAVGVLPGIGPAVAVAMLAVSPGVFSNMEVVEPPYIAP